MKKKVLAILLAAVMVMMLLPTVAFAATEITAITLDTNFTDLVGKKFGDVKDSIFTNVKDGGGSTLEVVKVFGLKVINQDGAGILSENDKIQAGSYALYGIFKAPSGSSFRFTAPENSQPLFNGTINGENNPPTDTIAASPLTNGELTSPYDILDAYAKSGETATYLAFVCQVTLEEPEAPSNSGDANITGKIDIADFGYEMVIPSETVLTEAKHTDVLLGTHDGVDGDGKVYINVTKHPATNVDVFYTVTLGDAATLNDGNGNTITTTYGVSTNGTNFSALAENTKYTVYTGGEKVDSFINVTAADEAGDGVKLWKDAPVGDYNATVVFNFDDAEAKTVADIANGVENWTNGESKYVRYYDDNLIIVNEKDGTDAVASVPGTTVVTETTYNNGHDGDQDAWTCTVDGATYVFAIREGTVKVIQVSGLSNDDYNGVYADRK